MKYSLPIIFAIAVVAMLTWFMCLGIGRSRTLASASDNITPTLYVLMTASMAFFGKTILSRLLPVQELNRLRRLLKKRIKKERATVNAANKSKIGVEEQGFAYVRDSARLGAAHRIASDHTQAQNP